MKRELIMICAVFSACILLSSCSKQIDANTPAGRDGWLNGSAREKLDTVAKHLCGNDVVMIEVNWCFHQYWRP